MKVFETKEDIKQAYARIKGVSPDRVFMEAVSLSFNINEESEEGNYPLGCDIYVCSHCLDCYSYDGAFSDPHYVYFTYEDGVCDSWDSGRCYSIDYHPCENCKENGIFGKYITQSKFNGFVNNVYMQYFASISFVLDGYRLSIR